MKSCEAFPEIGGVYVEEVTPYYVFRTSVGCVLAQWMGAKGETSIISPPSGQKPLKVTMTEVSDIESFFGFIALSRDPEVFFPNFFPNIKEKALIFEWTQSEGTPDWKLIDHGPGGITLTKREVSRAVLWFPEEKEAS